MLWILVLGAILIWAPSPTITHRTTPERAHIKPKPCSVNGIEGTCMFVYECIKTDGKHVGMCVDNFMFGSCCSHNAKQNSIIPNHDHNHHHHHHHHHHHQSNSNVLYSSSSIYSSPRPPNHGLGGRPQTNKLRPTKPVGFLTYPTKKPPSTTYHHWLKEPSDSSSSTTATSHKQLGSNIGVVGKPWTNRPSPFVTSSDSGLKPSFPDVKFPAVGNAATEITQSLLILTKNSSLVDGGNSSTSSTAYDLIATSKPANIESLHGRNKTLSSTTVISSSSTTTPKTTAPTTTTTTTTTQGTSWSITKPSWHPNNIVASSKPWSQLSKPEILISEKPSFLTSQTVWTNEPHFVTRPRPQSNLWLKPKPTRKPVPYSGSLGSSSIRSNLTSNEMNQFGVNTSSPTANLTTQSTTSVMTTTATSAHAASSPAIPSSKPGDSTGSTTITTTSTTTAATTTTTTSSDPTETTTAFSKHSKYQYSGQCGVATLSPRPEMRIVGGKNAAFGGWPWQVSVRRTSFFGFSSTHRCGGAVINENWIATAGHCVDDLLTSQIRIRVGEYDFSSVQEPYPFVERSASKKVVHPKYNFFTYEYDLALVRLETSLEFQPHISPICLPASDDLLIGENATVTGWGRLSEGGTLPSVLQQVSVPIVSNDKCKSMFLRAGRHEFIPEIFLCAGYENGGQDSCQGDSGGPLQVKGKNGRYFLAGIISWGIGCAEANLPGVCTRISKFVPWILENVT